MSGDDFYGVEIGPDGDISYHGGYQPRPMTERELEPWLRLVESKLANEPEEATCLAV